MRSLQTVHVYSLFIETRFNLLLHLETERRLDFLHSCVFGWGTIHNLVHLHVPMSRKNKTFLHTIYQLLVFRFMFGVTFLKYCHFCCLFKNQVACSHRWGEIWFISFLLCICFLGLLEDLPVRESRNHGCEPFHIISYVDTLPRKSLWPTLIRKQCKALDCQEFGLFRSLLCAWCLEYFLAHSWCSKHICWLYD